MISNLLSSQNKSVISDTVVNTKNAKIIVDLPAAKNSSEKNKKYPVFFILDSQEKNIVDIVKSNIYYLQNFGKEIPEVIFVRVEIYDRSKLYFGEGVNELAEMLRKTIVHLNQYNALNYNIILGHSNSASFVLDIANNLNFSKLFHAYIAYSPSKTVDKLNVPAQDINLYLSHGGMGQYENSFKKETEAYKEKVDSINSPSFKVKYDYFPNANHNTIIPMSIYNSINYVFDPWIISSLETDFILNNKYDILGNLKRKYHLLERITNSKYKISPNEYVYIANLYYDIKDYSRAISITDEALTNSSRQDPDYYKIYFNRALYYFKIENLSKAKENIVLAQKYITKETDEYNYAYPMILYYDKFLDIYSTTAGSTDKEKKITQLLQLINDEKKISNNNLLVNFIKENLLEMKK
ncbi:hypothetical protein [Chryseobacterium sp. KLBC 52]|uniref:hypothetical protein n=1 Tax=Chryseobacterium sp. KLBC 52 TaxID=1862702 RepID=UPI0013B35E31|nr:hypothetical protein [Chryseobacterium sp. KLBC 52]